MKTKLFTPKHPVSLSSVVMALGWFFEKTWISRSWFLDNHLFLKFYQFLQNFFKVKEDEIDFSYSFVIFERFFWFVLAANVKKLRFLRSREKKPTHRGRSESYQYWEKNYSTILWLNNMQSWIYYREFVEFHNIVWKRLHSFCETSL